MSRLLLLAMLALSQGDESDFLYCPCGLTCEPRQKLLCVGCTYGDSHMIQYIFGSCCDIYIYTYIYMIYDIQCSFSMFARSLKVYRFVYVFTSERRSNLPGEAP